MVLSLATLTSMFNESNTTVSPALSPIIENLKGASGILLFLGFVDTS